MDNNRIPTVKEVILSGIGPSGEDALNDELLFEAGLLAVQSGQASISMFQRKFRIGFNRAAKLINALETKHVIGPSQGEKPRNVLMSEEEYLAAYDKDSFPDADFEPISDSELAESEDVNIAELFQDIYGICDSAEDILMVQGKRRRGKPLRDMLREDLLRFILYLTVSDGIISVKELEFLRLYLGYSFTPQQAKQYVIDNHIYSKAFENIFPESLMLLADADNFLYQENKSEDAILCPVAFEIFLNVGKLFREGKKEIDPQERENFRIYMTNLAALLSKRLENGNIEVV